MNAQTELSKTQLKTCWSVNHRNRRDFSEIMMFISMQESGVRFKQDLNDAC